MAEPSTPSRDLLIVSPSQAGSSAQKRKVTPSSETSSPKKIAVVLASGLISQAQGSTLRGSQIPNPLARIAIKQWHIDATRPLLFPNPLRVQSAADHPRHITLPFDFRDEPHRPTDEDASDLIMGFFPGTELITYDDMFLYLTMSTLPPRPWPKTIGGMPVRFDLRTGPPRTPNPPKFFKKGQPVSVRNGRVADDTNWRGLVDWQPFFHAVKDHFATMNVSITEVIYWKFSATVVLEHRHTDMSKIPATVGQVRCFYAYEDQMGRNAPRQARRQHEPSPGNPDNNQYQALRPGVRVSSAYLPSQPGTYMSTTTGVMLKDSLGYEYLTVTDHGFPAECGTRVMHPSPDGRDIGELIMGVGHTDIALVKLNQGERFANTTFHNTLLEDSTKLKRLVDEKSYRPGDTLYLDSPDTGCLDGTAMYAGMRRYPSDDPTKQHWVFVDWIYMGQNSAKQLPDGMCGSAVWATNGDVIGFFQYAPKDGLMEDWCAAVGSQELIDRGYSLSRTEIDED